MNKFIWLIGIIATAFVLSQIHQGQLGVQDVVFLPEEENMESLLEKDKEIILEEDEDEDEDEEIIPSLSIIAFGDMMLGRYVRVLMDRHGKDYIFEKLIEQDEDFFQGYDIVFANLEGPIKGQGRKGGTSLIFSFNEDIAEFLKSYNFNVLSISNNHSLDQGWAGRDTTIKALEEVEIAWCGHPTEADSESVVFGETETASFAFLCFQDVSSRLNYDNAVDLIKEVREEVDFVLVSIHWGFEYQKNPHQTRQIDPGQRFVDAGADLIIGHHPHVIQPFEIYKDRYIFYSLGNFIFDQYFSQAVQEGLGVKAVLKKTKEGVETEVELIPMKSEISQPYLIEGDFEVKEIFNKNEEEN